MCLDAYSSTHITGAINDETTLTFSSHGGLNVPTKFYQITRRKGKSLETVACWEDNIKTEANKTVRGLSCSG